MEKVVANLYGERIRVRACGIYLEDDAILLIQHKGIGPLKMLWSPPGGGIEFGESLEQAVVREFKEETGLEVVVDRFLFLHEFIEPPLHSIELYFLVSKTGGILKKGTDPEMHQRPQLISDLRLWKHQELISENPLLFHDILQGLSSFDELK